MAGVQDQDFLPGHPVQDRFQRFRPEAFLFLSIGKEQRHALLSRFFRQQSVGAQIDQRCVPVLRTGKGIIDQPLKSVHRARPVHLAPDRGTVRKEIRQQRLHRIHVVGAGGFRSRHGHEPVAADQQAPGHPFFRHAPASRQKEGDQQQADKKAQQYFLHHQTVHSGL